MKHNFFILLALFVVNIGWAQRFEYNGLLYEVTSENELINQIYPTVKVAQQVFYNTSGTVIIPSIVEYGGYKYNVTEIDEQAFIGGITIKSIEIPSSVIRIGSMAFYDCKNLTSIKIPNSVTLIGEKAFYNCEQISFLSLPNKNFYGTDLYVTKNGIRYMVINNKEVGVAYNPNGYSGHLVIPRTITVGDTFLVTSIVADAFYDGSNIVSITIPNSITSVTKDVFINCGELTTVTLPEELDVSYAGLEFTKDSIVYSVKNGKEVYIQHWDKKPTPNIVIPNSVTSGNSFQITGLDFNGFTYESYYYDFNENVTSVTIPANITYIGPGTFLECRNLINVTCLSNIPPKAFSNSFDNYNGYLHIPCNNMEAYDVHTCWGSFKHVKCIE